MSEKIPCCVEVAVPLPVRGTLTYRVPHGLGGSGEPGARAVVPIGRRVVTGVILRQGSGAGVDTDRLKDVIDLPDEGPVLPSELLRLVEWASRYYVATPGGMIASALPPGIGRSSEVVVRRLPCTAGMTEGLTAGERRVHDAIPAGGTAPLRRLGASAATLRRLEEAGLVRRETVLKPARVREKSAVRLRLSATDLESALAMCERAPRQAEALRLIASRGEEGILMGEIHDRLGPSGSAVTALVRKRLARADRIEVARKPALPDPDAASPRANDASRPATADQAAALARIEEAIDGGDSRAFLLMGVTGSGKTEVYLRSIERCLRAGRDALYLVPEIALTPLLARDLRSRLGDRLAILHSSLGPGERFDEWRRARRGEARVVLGARSAVLAPLGRVGLIVVDEEQDGSYKQEEDPRYNARDLALVRARKASAVAILGSATPSVESYHAARSGRLDLLSLPGRVLERPMAQVRVVDMRSEFLRTGREDLLSEPLREAVTGRLSRGEQAIILLNRRGYAPFLLCRSCGAADTCRRCSVGLTYHRAEDRMRCHYCGYRKKRPLACATCRSQKIALSGAGTEKLEEQLRGLFPQARLARLDRDTARGRRAPGEILAAFERGDFNLLVGTQMVAKGHDFPGVTIVGVIGADSVLSLPEFRAAERTFQLLTQVAGRSGRGIEPGEVVVQAYHCEHYAIEAAARQDYGLFYEKESRFRRIMRYPPFAVMANLIVQASSAESGVRRARIVGEALREATGPSMSVFGPAVAPIARLKGRYRYQILVKADGRRKLSDALNETASRLAERGMGSTRDLTIDMDPVSLA